MSLETESSKFASLLGSNDAPTEDEIRHIKASLSAKTEKMQEIRLAYEKLAQEIKSYRTLLSPVRRLSGDVLRQIFLHCLPTYHNAIVSPYEPPILLTRVCRTWRSVALNTPALWASIHLPAPFISLDAEDEDMEAIPIILSGLGQTAQQWLKHSGDLTLNISLRINTDSPYTAMHEDTSSTLINTFIGLSHRWATLSLDCLDGTIDSLLKLPAADLPSLHTLSIKCGSMRSSSNNLNLDTDPSVWTQTTLFQAPNLRSVALDRLPGKPTDFPLNWAQLTHLSIRSIGSFRLGDFAFIFRTCSALVSFASRIIFEGASEFPDGPRILCRHLEELSLIDVDVDRTALYKQIDLPSLRRLDYFRFPHKKSAILSLLPGTMGSIRHLITNPRATPPAALIAYLRHCPRLDTLSLVPGSVQCDDYGYQITNKLLELLSKKSDGSEADDADAYLCPGLQRLECLQAAEFSDSELLEFIRTKQDQKNPRIAKLNHVVVVFMRSRDISVDEELSSLQKVGLRTDIYYMVQDEAESEPRQPLFKPNDGLTEKDEEEVKLGVFGGRFRL